MTKPTKAAIYARISQDAEQDHLATTRQLEACRERAKAEGWTVVEELVDNSISASSFTKKDRPGYMTLMKGLKDGTYDAVVAYSTDRISRKLMDLVEIADLAKSKGVRVLTIQGGLADLSTAQGRMALEVAASFSAMESSIKSERHLFSNKQRYEAGKHYGRLIPLGYMRGETRIEIDPEVEPHLRWAFKKILDGGSCADVAEYWEKQGIKPKKGDKWRSSSVRQLLLNDVYAGVLKRKGVEITPKSGKTDWVPYLTLEEHELLKATLSKSVHASPGPRSPRAEYPLSGILLCSCGKHMTGRIDKGRRIYGCVGRATGECYRITRADEAEDKIYTYVVARLNTVKPEEVLAPEVLARQKEISTHLLELSREREQMMGNKALDRAARAEFVSEIIDERDALQRELREITKATLLGSIVGHVLNWDDEHLREQALSAQQVRAAFMQLGRSQQTELIRTLGEYLVVSNGPRRASTVFIAVKNLTTGEAEVDENLDEYVEMMQIMQRAEVSVGGEVIKFSTNEGPLSRTSLGSSPV